MLRGLDKMSLRFKAIFAVLGVIIVSLTIVGVSGLVQMQRLIASEEQRTAQAVARGIGRASELSLAVKDTRELSKLIAGFLRDEQILFIAIYDASGKLAAKSVRDSNAFQAYAHGNTGGDDFILGQQNVALSAEDNEFTLELSEENPAASAEKSHENKAVPRGGHLGRVDVGLSTAPAKAARAEQSRMTTISIVFALQLSAILVFLFVGSWAKRLSRLMTASERISKGNFVETITDVRMDEIGRLAHAYEQMRQSLCQRDAELHQFNATLQQQVSDRTRSLEEALQAAKTADQAKSRFLANMSHEIRTPLNGVVGMVDLLGGTTLTEQQKHYCRITKTSAASLLHLINDILDFSKIEAGQMELDNTEFDLPAMIEDVTETFSQPAAAQKIELACYVHPDVPDAVCGDPERLRQILTNFLANAVKFTEKGQVTVRCELLQQSPEDLLVKFAVTDTGIGIAADRKDRLFKVFSQVDASTTRKYGGTGLGLAISKKLVELLGGDVGVESQMGQGSTFWFTARLRKLPAGTKPRQLPLAEEMRGLRVLAVDDNAVNREILGSQLSTWELDIHTASDGAEALQSMRNACDEGKPYDMALLDWHMPGMDGIELAKEIRRDPRIKATSLVMLTSIEDRIQAEEWKSLGFAATLTKPARRARLLDTISTVVASKKAAASAVPSAPAEPRPARKPAQRNVRILLAEDNEVNQIVASEILAASGFQCTVVDNGRRALDAVTAGQCDLVLMDCQMPEMDGFEATRRIRAHEKQSTPSSHIPIIALTANAIRGDRELCLGAGMDAYVTKPIESRELIQTIESVLADARTAPPAPPAPSADIPQDAEVIPVDVPSLLSRCMGNADLVLKVLARFEAQLEKDVDKLGNALTAEQFDLIARSAHTIKGCAANLSAEGVRQHAAEIEKMGREKTLEHASAELSRLKDEVARCLAYLPEVRQQLAGTNENTSSKGVS